MALNPTDAAHAFQIQAGITGRKTGHTFELFLANQINEMTTPILRNSSPKHLFYGEPATALIQKCQDILNWTSYDEVKAIALGNLATAEEGKKWLSVNGIMVKACKSDILITLKSSKTVETIGVSVKQCNNKTPTNAQLYFTTAKGFYTLLNNNGIFLSDRGLTALKQFCGDEGFRPMDSAEQMIGRKTDPRRFFWEEIEETGKIELENLFRNKQDEITRLLLQKAYLNDPFTPQILLHKTKKITGPTQEYAIYSIEELIQKSREYSGFAKKKYAVRKGSYKDPIGVEHEAPRFGIVQMQRGGQAQHPTQLQFNLQAGYFYNI
jgi:hypothetical protein